MSTGCDTNSVNWSALHCGGAGDPPRGSVTIISEGTREQFAEFAFSKWWEQQSKFLYWSVRVVGEGWECVAETIGPTELSLVFRSESQECHGSWDAKHNLVRIPDVRKGLRSSAQIGSTTVGVFYDRSGRESIVFSEDGELVAVSWLIGVNDLKGVLRYVGQLLSRKMPLRSVVWEPHPVFSEVYPRLYEFDFPEVIMLMTMSVIQSSFLWRQDSPG